MKKNYTSPAIETTEVMIEAGIATSTVTFSLGDDAQFENYNNGEAIW